MAGRKQLKHAPKILAYPALLGRLCLERAPSAHLRLIRSRLFRCLDRALSRDVYLVLDDFGGHRINSQQKRFHQQAESTDLEHCDEYCECYHEPPKAAVLIINLICEPAFHLLRASASSLFRLSPSSV